ncbi:regulator of telomere elongation helicase 1 homolog isoform X1 [Coffea eugenioides]|uniref:regulator of telomere elongation helicase 1 homolog isoform X1 n=1 Tax=Coffea eugenioides TaxID=49369 RepID=UPI000F614E64|nr:regulator of telomere elongation helicase 1 homolog isoform X1 [Coffea eugenioides]
MPTYNLRGINVDFPYEAYDCQLVYMEKVIQALQTKSNALLESPTGTGKTLCLLCATLAWRKSLGGFSRGRSERSSQLSSQDPDESSRESQSSKLPTIIYTSRTHSQLRQVIQELKSTNYRPKMVVLGSREQLCIHEKVRSLHGKAQTNACHALCKKRKKHYCAHFSRVSEFLRSNPGLGDEPVDIEDLVNIGRSCGPCPYYLSRELHKVVDILFTPYNYLIDRGYRKTLNIEWQNSVLIFDEAHNLEGLCADAASFDLPSSLLSACISEAKSCVDLSISRRDKSNDKSCKPDNFAILRALLLKLEKRIAEVPIDSKELGFTKPGPYIYELLADLNVTTKTATMLIDIIDEAVLLLEEDANISDDGGQKTKGTVCRLESMGDIFKLIFRDNYSHANNYRVHVQEVEGSTLDAFKGKTSRILSWWCFNPGIAMEEFSRFGVRSIVLTSGTLSPMDSFAEELKLEFPIRLENPHVITENQIWAGVVPAGPSGYAFNSSYRSRDSLEYKQELGNAIVNFARIVPNGLLVFFPSYYLLDQCIGCWKTMGHTNLSNSSTIWERICKHKLPVVEPRQSSLFPMSIEDYMTKLKDKSASGAVFFAVCRGKVSEGLDFADHAGRAVVITGIPFATRTDPKVRLKREYLDEHAQLQQLGQKNSQALTGEEWYSQQASRAVNQAVGRVIRHRHDYGAIIFCDERFSNSNRQSQMSLWMQPHVKCYSKFGDVVFTLTRFFRDGGICGPTKLELTRNSCQGNVESSQPLDKLHSDKLLTTDTSCTVVSVSSPKKRGTSLSHLTEVVPANRSSLTSHKLNIGLKLSSNANLLSHLSTNMQCSFKDAVGSTNYDLSGTKSGQCIAPCSLKKPRLVITGHEQTESFEKSDEPSCSRENSHATSYSTGFLKNEKLQWFNDRSKQNAQDSRRLLESEVKVKIMTSTSIDPKDKEKNSASTASNDEERKGSAFLIQVQEKLTDAEYKEFVSFMKALKSKAMKIGHVLESIARLFSLPDRLPLLHGFKDYIPAKYHSMYDHHVQANQNVAGL